MSVNIAVNGCCHGELDVIYREIQNRERYEGIKVDLLLICGDFESIRTESDLACVAVPDKYKKLTNFYEYVMGTKVAPVLTIFIGGNHEASNVLQSLYYGGYVAPNIYFLGFAGVVNFRGIRISGLSGIYHQGHYRSGKFEKPPYSPDTLRSIYHLRELEVYRMKHLEKTSVDVFMTHDWPLGIVEYGDKQTLLRIKPYFREEVDRGTLGSPPAMQLLRLLKPSYWFSGHMHVKFEATVPHDHSNSNDNDHSSDDLLGSKRKLMEALGLSKPVVEVPVRRAQSTNFLALDKVLPGRSFLEIVQVPLGEVSSNEGTSSDLQFDFEWLAVIQKTHSLVQGQKGGVKMPDNIKKITQQDIDNVRSSVLSSYGSANIPHIIPVCVVPSRGAPVLVGNAQTDKLLSTLNLEHRWTCPLNENIPTTVFSSVNNSKNSNSSSSYGSSGNEIKPVVDDNAIDIDI